MSKSMTVPGTDVATLTLLFESSYSVVTKNIEGVDHAASLLSPPAGGNGMSWIMAHLLGSRNALLARLDQEPVIDGSSVSRFARGARPLTDPSEALPWTEMVAAFSTSQERLRAGLSSIAPDGLAAALPEDQNPFRVASVGQLLHVLNFHETYHAGQLGALRHLSGLKGAIR